MVYYSAVFRQCLTSFSSVTSDIHLSNAAFIAGLSEKTAKTVLRQLRCSTCIQIRASLKPLAIFLFVNSCGRHCHSPSLIYSCHVNHSAGKMDLCEQAQICSKGSLLAQFKQLMTTI